MSLSDELLAVALGFARSRLDELTGTVLADVDAFAAALGAPGFVDDGGEVAGLLATARSEVAAAGPRLGARDFVGGATHLANAVNAVDQAVAKVPGRQVTSAKSWLRKWGDTTLLRYQLLMPTTGWLAS